MTPVGIVLLHGYLGSPADLAPLAADLQRRFGADAIDCLYLPGHGASTLPAFDKAAFLDTVAQAIETQRARGRKIILLGHSTGGSLCLAEIARRAAANPAGLNDLLLLVLCATPPRIDTGYITRWQAHSSDLGPPLEDVAALVALVNRLTRRRPLVVPCPVLIVQGDDDTLVPAADAALWRDGRLAAPVRCEHIAGAGHDLFRGTGAEMAIDSIGRAIDDAIRRAEPPETAAPDELLPGARTFLATWPDARRHLLDSPAGLSATNRPFAPAPSAATEPTLANIEITTRCNLGCKACARTQLKVRPRDMSRADFERVLERLPHAWRVVLVGLGEPLLHPEAVDFVRLAVAAERRVSLVSNGMCLDAAMARELCASGLAGITFSLDAADPATARRVRAGSDLERICANIRGLVEERRRQGASLVASAFTALSQDTVAEFETIVDLAADLGLDALMATDLNFPANQSRSLHRALSPDLARLVRKALKRAVARRLPVLSVRGLEELALDVRYPDFLLFRGEQLAHRSGHRSNCASPWQSIPVNVEGHLSLCDCQPTARIGNIHHTPLSAWWNGPAMVEQRRRMLGNDPPPECLACPRF